MIFNRIVEFVQMKKIVIAVLIIALLTRFIWLDVRPMDHDESVHAWIALKSVLEGHNYKYDPAFHGPFLYFSSALMFKIFGDSDFTARLTTALFSVLGVLVSLGFKRWIGNSAYIFTFFMLFSPSILYYSRYDRNDLIVLASFLTAIYFYLRYREERKILFACLSSFFFAILFTSKENWVEYLPIFILFALFYKIKFEKNLRLNIKGIFAGVVVFLAFSSFLYSSAFVCIFSGENPLNYLLNPSWIEHYSNVALSYWFSHAISFGKPKPHFHPVWFFIPILLKYEFLAVALFISSIPLIVKRFRDLSFLELFAIWWCIVALTFYHVMSYKTPWLVVHIATPLAFLGSIFVGREVFRKKSLMIVFVIAAIATVIASFYITYINYNDARNEELIYVQTQPQAIEMANEIRELVYSGKRVAVYVPQHYYWPLPWILRHEKNVTYYGDECPVGYDYVFTTAKEECEKKGYKALRSYEFRVGFYFYKMVKSSSP